MTDSRLLLRHNEISNEHTQDRAMTVADLCGLIVCKLAERLDVDPQSIDAREQFSRYGLDSRGATGLLADLAQALGRPLPAILTWRYPTPEALAHHLAGGASEREASAHDGPRAQGGRIKTYRIPMT
jgi:acyl carrier protein